MANWWHSIRDQVLQIKGFLHILSEQVLMLFLILFVGLSAFGLGRLSATEKVHPAIEMTQRIGVDEKPMALGGKFVASKKGTKYHYPWCAGARAMNESNKIWFDTAYDAKQAGFTPAGNCKGLK